MEDKGRLKSGKTSRQESWQHVIEAITSELELHPLLTNIVRYACELLNADRGTIGLVDESRQLVRTEAVYKMPDGELGSEMPIGIGLAGQVLARKEPVLLNRYGEVPQPTRPEILDDAVLGMPIMWREEMIGFFGIGASFPRQFSAADAETLSFFARHAAIAIHNARQFEAEKRRVARMRTISTVGQLITASLSLDEVLTTAFHALSEELDYTHIALFLVDENDPTTLVLRARRGIYAKSEPGQYRQALDEGIIGAAARSKQVLLVPDVHRGERYLKEFGAEAVQSELAVPMIADGRLLGVLNVESEQVLDEVDAEALGIVAGQLATAVKNAGLFTQTKRALAEMQLLYETSRRISMAMDVRGVVEAYLEQVAMRRRYACSVVIFTVDDAGARSEIIILGRWTPERGLSHPDEHHAYFQDSFDALLDAGQTVTISDVGTDPRVSAALRQAQKAAGRPALALIPLMVRGRRIGSVSLSHPHVHEWSEADLRPYQVTAAQLATAIYSRQQQQHLLEQEHKVAVLEERQRLSRELHDSVTQLIFSMTLIAQSIAPAMRDDPVKGEARVNRLLELAQKARAEMRALLVELRPSTAPVAPLVDAVKVRREGLAQALRDHVDGITHDGLIVHLDVQGYIRQAEGLEEALFRISQEALNNIVKHAQAEHVHIKLWTDHERCHLMIEDDGRGFDAQVPKEGHFGLRTMRERIETLGGQLHLSSAGGEGTTVKLVAPLTIHSLK
jgi:signal transduction histidine kinase/putative methionine-R-sulfoxide reductase with GAF domain